MSSVRKPVVAGKFYPAEREALREQVAGLLGGAPSSEAFGERARPRAVMVPHAGYVYSGRCAAEVFRSLELPQSVLLLGPNHTGRGADFSAAPEDYWLTPLGSVAIDRALLDAIAARFPDLRPDASAHRGEHSLEVQVPFLQALRQDVRVAPIAIGTHDPARLAAFGDALAEVIGAWEEAPLLVISSDMTHYEPAEEARVKDEQALAALESLDPRALLEVVSRERITMCGVAPAAAALVALRRLGAERGLVRAYTHSGIVTGDDRDVVAYAGVTFD